MSEDLNYGALLRLRTVRHYPDPTLDCGIIYENWTAEKGYVFMAYILGVEKQDGSEPLDVDARMNEFGWHAERESADTLPLTLTSREATHLLALLTVSRNPDLADVERRIAEWVQGRMNRAGR